MPARGSNNAATTGGGGVDGLDIASAGNGGVATAAANGGAIGTGNINSGGNVGNAIAVGDTYCAEAVPVTKKAADEEGRQVLTRRLPLAAKSSPCQTPALASARRTRCSRFWLPPGPRLHPSGCAAAKTRVPRDWGRRVGHRPRPGTRTKGAAASQRRGGSFTWVMG